MYAAAASESPVQIKELLPTGHPRSPAGTLDVCGARRRSIFHFRSIGASGMKSRQHSSRRRMPAFSHNPCDSTTELSGCSLSSNSVTTPKLPPPPRNAQYKSEFSFSLQRTSEPSAVTTSAPTTLSQDNPNRRVSHPVPPPKISPEDPVWETTPDGKTSPAFCVALSIDPRRQPPETLARRLSG